jgi:hypothetical protein
MYRFAYRMRTATAHTALVFAVCSLLSFASAQSEAPGWSGTEKSASSSRTPKPKSKIEEKSRPFIALPERSACGLDRLA